MSARMRREFEQLIDARVKAAEAGLRHVEQAWQARALAAEAKLARLEGLEKAAREYAKAVKVEYGPTNLNELKAAAIDYASGNPE